MHIPVLLPASSPASSSGTARTRGKTWRLRGTLLTLLALSCSAALAVGSNIELDAAQALWLQGQRTQALQRVQTALTQNPNDSRLRFAKAVMQMELGQKTEAEATLLALTQDFPDLADPYNNLAVLYAARGDLDQARAALEQAVRLQPAHAQALENLGDVLLRLAARAYQQALHQNQGDTAALKLKLSRTQALLDGATGSKPEPRP